MLSLSRLVADLYAKDGIRCNAVTPGPDRDRRVARRGRPRRPAGRRPRRGAREGRRRPPARPPRRARGDRRRGRLPLLRPRLLRDRRRLERRRRHRPDHHLSVRAAISPRPAARAVTAGGRFTQSSRSRHRHARRRPVSSASRAAGGFPTHGWGRGLRTGAVTSAGLYAPPERLRWKRCPSWPGELVTPSRRWCESTRRRWLSPLAVR